MIQHAKLQSIGQSLRLLCALAFVGLSTGPFSARAYTSNDVQTAFNAFSNVFYVRSGTNAWIRNLQNGGSGATYFWGQANEIECVIDAYEVTSNAAYKTLITNLLNGFKYNNGSSWANNSYNDDVMWACMAFARGYLDTQNSAFRDLAKNNFDMCYARGWDTNAGGMYWTTGKTNKVSAVNGPASIAAYLLYQSYNDASYLTKAHDIYNWERTNFFVASTGKIYDGMSVGGAPGGAATTYNQGTFIGAANFLGQTNDAWLAAGYTLNSMCSSGILPQYGTNNNNSGFNAIFIRWLTKFMRDRGWSGSYRQWLQDNANAAWNLRRTTDNLSWCQWRQQTPAAVNLYSWDCIASFEILQTVPPTQSSAPGVVFLTNDDLSGTSSFISAGNWSDGNAPSGSNNYVVNGCDLRTPADAAFHNFCGSALIVSNAGGLRLTSGGALITVGTMLSIDNGIVSAWTRPAQLGGWIRLQVGGAVFDPQSVGGLTLLGPMDGPGALTVASDANIFGGTLTLCCSNAYAGGTILNGPETVQLTNLATLGMSTNSLLFEHNGDGLSIPHSPYTTAGYGLLNLNGVSLSVGNLSGGGGRIVNNAASGTAVLRIGNGNYGGGSFYGSIFDHTSGGGVLALVKAGTGTIALCGSNAYTGGTLISGGTLQLGDGQTAGGSLAGNITNNAQLVFANPGAQTISAVISGAGALTKLGGGALMLTATNTYTGSTLINAGTLALSGNGSISNCSSIAVTSGAVLDVSGRNDRALRLMSGQTLSGGGKLTGDLSAQPGSMLVPGDAGGIGVLPLQGNASLAGGLLMSLNRTNALPADQLSCTGSLSGGGTLTVSNIGPELLAGDVFALFNQPVSGFSQVILPSLAPGLLWVNYLARDGTLRVLSSGAFAPVNLSLRGTGTNLLFSWPADHIGWRLQAQTNSLATGLGSHWVDLADSANTNQLCLPLDPGGDCVFFRLIYR